MPRPPRPPAQDFTRGNRWVREVALTFDGHDLANVAQEILEILRAADVRVTMFLGGQFIRRHPEIVRRMLEDGHQIGNHLVTVSTLLEHSAPRNADCSPRPRSAAE
jgi:peptidoglycan/xylan/chitin deacetylase (PgdA/CDA1 family)